MMYFYNELMSHVISVLFKMFPECTSVDKIFFIQFIYI